MSKQKNTVRIKHSSEEVWINDYKPQLNHIDRNSCLDGTMFETYGVELAYVEQMNDTEPNRVWTYIEGDNESLSIISGMHFVNRIGYFITETPFHTQIEVDIELI